MHVKAATQGPRGWRAIALDDTDGSWRDLLARLPHEAPRGIEFPLQGDDRSRHPPLRQYFACGVTQDDNVNGNDGAAGAPDVVTLGEAMAMFVAAQTGDLAEVETFTKRIAGAELNVAIGPPVWA